MKIGCQRNGTLLSEGDRLARNGGLMNCDLEKKKFLMKCQIYLEEKYFMKIRLGLVLILILIMHAGSFAQSPDSLLHLSDLIKEGLENNLGIKGLYSVWQADQAKIPQAGALPDPVLSFNLMNLPINSCDFDQEPMTGKQISLMQMFPFPGKLGLQEKIAQENSAISEAKYQELRNQLVKDIKQAYYDIFFVDKAIETTQKNTQLIEQFVSIAQTKYTVGKGLQQDVLKAQVELSKMTDKLITLQQKREALAAQLNSLLNRPAETPVGKPMEPGILPLQDDLAKFKDVAEENRPLLKAWQAMVNRSEQSIRLAKKSYFPDFRIGVAYTQRDVLQSGMGGVDFLSAMFSINLPIYSGRKQSKKVQESQFVHDSAQENLDNIRNQIFSALQSQLTEAEKNSRLMNLYKTGIIPQASQSLNSAIAGYQNDKVDFLTMLNNQITLFNYELDYYRILSDYNKNIVGLEALTGIRFDQDE
jgi:cobalt-zinc-cadmium efflux system outer membrane protein